MTSTTEARKRRLAIGGRLAALGLTLAIGAAGSLAAAQPSDAAGPGKTVTVSLAISKAKSTPKAAVKLSGKVRYAATKKAVKRTKVRLQQRLQGSKAWKTVKTLKTSAKGTYSITVRPATTRSYRVIVLRNAHVKARTSKTRNVTVITPAPQPATTPASTTPTQSPEARWLDCCDYVVSQCMNALGSPGFDYPTVPECQKAATPRRCGAKPTQ